MLVSSLSLLVATLILGGALGGAPSVLAVMGTTPISIDSGAFDTTQVVVTPADFAQLSTFLEATSGEWNKEPMQQLLQHHLVSYPLVLGKGVNGTGPVTNGASIRIPNYTVVADSVPAVAQGLAKAKLTGRRYIQLSRTLNCAFLTDQLDRMSNNGTPKFTDTSTIIGKNVAFIRAHQAEFQKLVRLELDVSQLQTQGGGDDDLNP